MTGLDLLRAALPGHDAFVVRAARYLAGEVGIRQFLDLGSGVSDGPPLHAVVGQMIPATRVLYVTGDPALFAEPGAGGSGSVGWCKSDLTDPAAVLGHAGAVLDLTEPVAVDLTEPVAVDLTEPVAVVLTGVLHLLDDADLDALVTALVGAVVTESHIVVSHLARDIHPGEMDALRQRLNDTTPEVWSFRNRDHVRSLFAGLDMVDPGVVGVDDWRPTLAPQPLPPGTISPVWVGVGRKP